jgi:hypothetical protein
VNRCEWEADAAAHRRGFADRHALFAHLAAERAAAAREAERQKEAITVSPRPGDNVKVADWIRRFEAARQSNRVQHFTI